MTQPGEVSTPSSAISVTGRPLSVPDETVRLLLLSLDDERYALKLEHVERVVRAVALDPLPGAPSVIRGIFNLQGRIIPVGDIRRRLGRREKAMALSDRIVIARSTKRPLGLVVDDGTTVIDVAAKDIVAADTVINAAPTVEGVVKTADGLVIIQDLEKFLSLAEGKALDEALHGRQ